MTTTPQERAARAEAQTRKDIRGLALVPEDARKITYINRQLDSDRPDEDKQFLRGVRSDIIGRYRRKEVRS